MCVGHCNLVDFAYLFVLSKDITKISLSPNITLHLSGFKSRHIVVQLPNVVKRKPVNAILTRLRASDVLMNALYLALSFPL